VTKRAFLSCAGLSTDGKAMSRLPAALDRLKRPFALLRSGRITQNGRLRLEIYGRWLPYRYYCRIPLPLPMGASAMALHRFLFRHVIPAPSSAGKIRRKGLYRWLGIRSTGPSHAKRALETALDAFNTNLSRLDRVALSAAHFDCPASVSYVQLGGDWIKFMVKWDHREYDRDGAAPPGVVLQPKLETQGQAADRSRDETQDNDALTGEQLREWVKSKSAAEGAAEREAEPPRRDAGLAAVIEQLKATSFRDAQERDRKTRIARSIFGYDDYGGDGEDHY